jgi:hypothetical protein
MAKSARPKTAMPDPMAKWTPVPDWTAATITRDDWGAKPVLGLSMVLVGGNMALALRSLAPGLPELGLWQIATAPDYCVRIGRDRALIVTSEPIHYRPGWQSDGWSASPAESAYGTIDFSGAALSEIVSEAAAADVEAGSRSAAVLFAGIPCMLIRTAPDAARLHMEIGHMPYLWRWLETRG